VFKVREVTLGCYKMTDGTKCIGVVNNYVQSVIELKKETSALVLQSLRKGHSILLAFVHEPFIV
jgi:hypothetical protein